MPQTDSASECRGRILAIDNTPSDLRLLMNMLTLHSYIVHPATSGQSALRFLEVALPDLILLDVMMPNMDGYQVCERMKANERTREIPVIFISAAMQPLNKVKAFGCGGVDYIVKPFQAEEVLARIETHLALRSLQERLEKRVEERTAELGKANAQLKEEIAERKRAEKALHASEQTLHELVDILPTAVYVCDASGLIESYNRRAAELWGREPRCGDSADRFCGSYRIYTPDGAYLPHAECPMAQVLRTGMPASNQEILIERPDGSRRIAMVNAIPRRDEQGNMTGAINCLTDITERKQAEQALQRAHDELELRVKERTTELSRANAALQVEISERTQAEEALREGMARLRALSGHLHSVREEQSAQIAREVHDDLGGTLSMLKLGVAQVLEQIEEPKALRYKLASLLQLADSAIQGVKRISTSLRPSMLDTLGLTATIKWHSNEFSRLTGIGHELHLPDYVRLSPERSTAVFRIIQEALTNVARHAHATKVTIKVWKNKGRLFVEIADNGQGISEDAFAKQESFGILGMRERSQFLGGELTVSGAPGQGTTVSFSVPFD